MHVTPEMLEEMEEEFKPIVEIKVGDKVIDCAGGLLGTRQGLAILLKAVVIGVYRVASKSDELPSIEVIVPDESGAAVSSNNIDRSKHDLNYSNGRAS